MEIKVRITLLTNRKHYTFITLKEYVQKAEKGYIVFLTLLNGGAGNKVIYSGDYIITEEE